MHAVIYYRNGRRERTEDKFPSAVDALNSQIGLPPSLGTLYRVEFVPINCSQ